MSAAPALAHTPHETAPLPHCVLTERWRVGGDGTFLGPSGLALLDEGTVLVVDECQHSVAVLDAAGALVRRIGAEGDAPGEFRYPTQAAADGAGGFWVTDRWNHRVQRLDGSGRVITVTGTYGPGPGEFNEPWGVVMLEDGRLVVSDRSNHRLQLLSSEGVVEGTCGQGGYGRPYYEGRRFKHGYIFRRWSAITNRFASHETFFHVEGYALGTLEYPQGIAACGDGRVLVADPGLGVVQGCTPGQGSVEALALLGPGRYVPVNIAALGDGLFLAVADFGNQACLFDDGGGSTLVEVPGIEHLTACVAGPGRTLWCLDGWNHCLVCYGLDIEPAEGTAP